jgi:hypothetical protein
MALCCQQSLRAHNFSIEAQENEIGNENENENENEKQRTNERYNYKNTAAAVLYSIGK